MLLDTLQRSYWKIKALAAASASEECLKQMRVILKGIPILFIADRDDINEYAILASDGTQFTAAKGKPTPPPEAVILRARESRLRPALDARKSLEVMVQDGILEVALPERFQAEPALRSALKLWYTDWQERQKLQASLADDKIKLPVEGWLPVAGRPLMPLVTVIGAGVAGMTAATELAERGFRVQLVDAHRDDLPESPVSPGGIAKSQRRRLPDSDRTMTPSRPMLQFNYPVPLDVGDRQFPLADSACRQALVNYEADRRVELQDDMRNPEESEPLWLVDPLRRRLHSPGRRVLPVWVEACRVINDLILGDGAPPEPPELAAVPPGENPPKTESPPVPTRDWYLGIQVRRRADPNTGRLSVRDARIQATAVLHQLKDLLKTSQSDPWHQQVWTLCGWQCEPYEGAIPAH
ncbi:MAG TPA: FAD-dependent oxidoreductase, partial [Myxococcota bacterium]|nr:FAD-dependent oxidoreductase [Myxococcota bacterium]